MLKMRIFYIACLICFSFTAKSLAEQATVKDLLMDPLKYDGEIVEVSAEVIGELLYSEKGQAWINISDNGEAIGVMVEKESLIDRINFWGSYRQKGDIISVRGVFFKDCPEHQASDIHASQISVIQRGKFLKEEVDDYKKQLFKFAAMIWLIIAAVYFVRAKIKRNI